jgi:hypothetical protein
MRFFGKRGKAVTREQIVWCYRTLLGREPESEAAILAHTKAKSFQELVENFARSPEFIGNTKKGVSRDEIVWCYRTLLGRDPESEAAILVHSNAENFKALVESFAHSTEFRAKTRRMAAPGRLIK